MKPGSRPYRTQLRTRLLALGFSEADIVEQVATDLMHNCRMRAREAWRNACELSLDAVADRFNTAQDDERAPMRKGRIWDFEQWPHSGARPTQATLRILAQIYGITWDRLVDLDDLSNMSADDRDDYHAAMAARRRVALTPAVRHVIPRPRATESGPPSDDQLPGDRMIEAAAEESTELANWVGTTNVDDASITELNRALRSLAFAYVYALPYPLLGRTRRFRDRVFGLLQGHQNWRHRRDLYLLSARACTLLAWMSGDLGNYLAAGDHASAGWMCAELADHDGARQWLRATQSKLCYWSGDYVQSAQLAADGLRYRRADSAGVLLALLEARATARMGRVGDATAALSTWQTELERIPGPDEVGGLLGLSEAQQHYLAGSAHLELREPATALTEIERSIALFEASDNEQRFYGAEQLTRIDQVRAHLLGGDLEAADAAIDPVLSLDSDQRLDTFVQGLALVRRCLANPDYRGDSTAQTLQERIEAYTATAIGRHVDLRR